MRNGEVNYLVRELTIREAEPSSLCVFGKLVRREMDRLPLGSFFRVGLSDGSEDLVVHDFVSVSGEMEA